MPLSRQRVKRRWVFFQSPSSGGSSRQGGADAQDPQDGIDEQTITDGLSSSAAFATGQVCFDQRPLLVGEVMAAMGRWLWGHVAVELLNEAVIMADFGRDDTS